MDKLCTNCGLHYDKKDNPLHPCVNNEEHKYGNEEIKQLQQTILDLNEILTQIIATEESYDDEQTVLGEIYSKAREALAAQHIKPNKDRVENNPQSLDEMRIRIIEWLNQNNYPFESLTCDDCKDRFTCKFVYDPYNTNGDCLANK